MKSLNFFEIESLAHALQPRLPAQLQEVFTTQFGVALAMYSRGKQEKSWWLYLDLTPARPGFFFKEEKVPWFTKKKSTPVGLFLNSHASDLYLKHVEIITEYGRVVQFVLGNNTKEVIIEFEVIPRSPNLIVKTSDNKKIAWSKPKERQEVQKAEIDEARSVGQILREWGESFGPVKKDNPQQANVITELLKKRQRDLEKKKKALAEIEKTLNSDEDKTWFELGELLKWKTLKDLDPEWSSFVDTKLNASENRERAFAKGKQLQDKKEGTLKRKLILLEEIEKLESNEPEDLKPLEPKSKVPKIKDTKLRTKTLDSGFVAHMGKSAQDNMKLLRQSQPWDYWIHLRDYPSSHAILHRNKNQTVSVSDLEEVAHWLALASLGTKQALAGQKISAMYAECRFVKAIKGDKIGRVNYQNEKTLTVRLQK